jgi:hypothetical protein
MYINTPQRRVRQMMYTEYYYPEATEERLNNDRRHTRKLNSLLHQFELGGSLN